MSDTTQPITEAGRGDQAGHHSMTRYALSVTPREPELMPLDLMGQLIGAIAETAEANGFRCYYRDATGFGVMWFEQDEAANDVV